MSEGLIQDRLRPRTIEGEFAVGQRVVVKAAEFVGVQYFPDGPAHWDETAAGHYGRVVAVDIPADKHPQWGALYAVQLLGRVHGAISEYFGNTPDHRWPLTCVTKFWGIELTVVD